MKSNLWFLGSINLILLVIAVNCLHLGTYLLPQQQTLLDALFYGLIAVAVIGVIILAAKNRFSMNYDWIKYSIEKYATICIGVIAILSWINMDSIYKHWYPQSLRYLLVCIADIGFLRICILVCQPLHAPVLEPMHLFGWSKVNKNLLIAALLILISVDIVHMGVFIFPNAIQVMLIIACILLLTGMALGMLTIITRAHHISFNKIKIWPVAAAIIILFAATIEAQPKSLIPIQMRYAFLIACNYALIKSAIKLLQPPLNAVAAVQST